MMQIMGVLHALRLYHIDLLHKMPIEKGIVDIKLVNSPLVIECNAKSSTEGDRIYHGIESLVKINALLLVKAFSNKASFIPYNRAIKIFLMRSSHLFPTTFYLGLRGTRVQVLFGMRASYSSCIA